VIHAVHSNEIWDLGGLAKKMPVTHVTFLIATLAIAGIWPLAGFFSKDEILAAAFDNNHPVLFGVALFVAGLTAFYMFRIYFVTFWGKPRGHGAEHAHESSLVMLVPLLILAVLSVVAGFIPVGSLVKIGEVAEEHHGGIRWEIAIPATLVALLGIGMAWFFYVGQNTRAAKVAEAFGVAYCVVKKKFYIDEVYLFVTHRIIFNCISRPIAWFDRRIVDGGVNFSGWATRMLGVGLRQTQTGQVQTYGAVFVFGALVVLLALWAK
jgi:NADH-quinone oxidoreductase subunit L